MCKYAAAAIRLLSLTFVAPAALASCTGQPLGETPPSEAPTILRSPFATIATEPQASTTSESTETHVGSASTPAPAALSTAGPWIIFPSEDGIWAMNSDGSGLVKLTDLPYLGPNPPTASVAPSGGRVAFVTYWPDRNSYQLAILSLPLGHIELVTPLLNSSIDFLTLDWQEAVDLEASVALARTLEWSPDGRYLAFVGAQDGPSPDVYVLALDGFSMLRLTSGPTYAVDPTWSPDGAYVLHGAASALNWENAPDGYSMTGFWAARADGSELRLLYPLSAHGYERILGWVSTHEFLARTQEFPCNDRGLRMVDTQSGRVFTIWTGEFGDAAVDPGQRLALVATPYAVGAFYNDICSFDYEPGYYLLPLDGTAPGTRLDMPIDVDDWIRVDWVPAWQRFLVSSRRGLFSVSSEGSIQTLLEHAVTDQPAVSADGTGVLADTVDGLWLIRAEQPPRRIATGYISSYVFSSGTSDGVVFSTDQIAYIASAPEYEPDFVTNFDMMHECCWEPLFVAK